MFGMKAMPYIWDVARQADKAIHYVSTALKVVPLVAPEYGEAAIQLDESLGTVSMGSQAAPYLTNTASSIAQKVDNSVPFGSVRDLTTSSRYITAEKL